MTTQTEITQRNHHRAVRFFWGFLIGATLVSLIGNIAHAVLPYIPRIVVQIGAAAVPPIALLAAVHGIALAVRAGASGIVYRWAVSAVAVIGVGAFAVSFLALRDLTRAIGYSAATAWIFPAIIDTAVAVSTLMLVALGDKPARRTPRVSTQIASARRTPQPSAKGAKGLVKHGVPLDPVHSGRAQLSAPQRSNSGHAVQDSAQAEAVQADADLALGLIASGVTTQPVKTVVAVLSSRRDGASINAAPRALGINYRNAQRIVKAAAKNRQQQLAAVG
jgi:hypothetical protein